MTCFVCREKKKRIFENYHYILFVEIQPNPIFNRYKQLTEILIANKMSLYLNSKIKKVAIFGLNR